MLIARNIKDILSYVKMTCLNILNKVNCSVKAFGESFVLWVLDVLYMGMPKVFVGVCLLLITCKLLNVDK